MFYRKMPGWYQGVGYSGDDGKDAGRLYGGCGVEAIAYGPTFTVGDTVGCGIRDNKIFFTKNGQNINDKILFHKNHEYVGTQLDGKYNKHTYNMFWTNIVGSARLFGVS